jgi:hypothetical protein
VVAALFAVAALVVGFVAAAVYGSWARDRDCHSWAGSRGYQAVHFDANAKRLGCSAQSTDGGEHYHDPDLKTYGTMLAWQLGIIATGCVPAAVILLVVEIPAYRDRRRRLRSQRPALDRLMQALNKRPPPARQ